VDYAELEGQKAREYEAHRRRVREKEPELPNHLGAAVLEGEMRFEEISDKTDILHLTLLEDYVVQVGQGKVPDRGRDTLGRLDAGVFLMRKIWERELKALADGRPLKNWISPGKLHVP
jgi:5,5'-dehydrodivanillate O-demethylase